MTLFFILFFGGLVCSIISAIALRKLRGSGISSDFVRYYRKAVSTSDIKIIIDNLNLMKGSLETMMFVDTEKEAERERSIFPLFKL